MSHIKRYVSGVNALINTINWGPCFTVHTHIPIIIMECCLRSAQADQMMALFCRTYSHARDSVPCLRIAQADQLMALLSCTYSHADGSVLCLRSVRADAVMALFRCTYSHAYGRVLCHRFVRPDQLMALFHCTYSVPTIECSVFGGGGVLITQWPFFTVHIQQSCVWGG